MSIEHPNWTLHEYSWFPVSKCKCRGISFNTMIPRNPFKPSHPPILINDPMSEEYCHFDQDELNAFHNRSVTWDYSKARICYTTDGQSVHSSYLASTIPQSILYIPGYSSLPISPPPISHPFSYILFSYPLIHSSQSFLIPSLVVAGFPSLQPHLLYVSFQCTTPLYAMRYDCNE